jgi:2-polyprenyl-3-methyl-5-hydroxy-6-metoxy-1,4-benzoquinol methylase
MNNKMIYTAINQPVFQQIPLQAKRILDVGCGSGVLGRAIKQTRNCEIVGITYSNEEAKLASESIDEVIITDINEFSPSLLGEFDCVICSHILEHLYQPERFLAKLNKCLGSDGIIIIALPNTLHYKQRLEFLRGNFKYTDGGLMDKTHFRFFDWDTALELVSNSGLQIVLRYADGYLPLPLIRKFKLLQPVILYLDKLASAIMPGLLGNQFIIVAKTS